MILTYKGILFLLYAKAYLSSGLNGVRTGAGPEAEVCTGTMITSLIRAVGGGLAVTCHRAVSGGGGGGRVD